MKNILAAAFILTLSLPLFSQRTTPNTYSRFDDYMQRSKRKERAGVILLTTGSFVTAGGTILIIDGANRYRKNGDYYGNGELNGGEAEIVLGVLVTVLGVASMSASIPFFVGAHRSRMRAIGISFKTETAPLPYKTAISGQSYPALSFHIPLSK
ncbi:MAG: hypothetical protein ABUT20_45620 [Bacteroidota bacterium]